MDQAHIYQYCRTQVEHFPSVLALCQMKESFLSRGQKEAAFQFSDLWI